MKKTSVKLKKKGFVAITPTICQGDVMAWATEDGNGNDIPVVYNTEETVWKEIADDLIIELNQFINGDRDFEDTNFRPTDYVASYEEYSDGRIVVRDIQEPDRIILKTTLNEWRQNR